MKDSIYKEDKSSPIGVFDSGVGGLTVAREIMRQLPNEKIVYFGDTARVPYGSKSKNTVIRYAKQIVRFLETKNVKAIVIACNTASAFALDELRKETKLPVIGVIIPGAKTAVENTTTKRIGVIGTEGTIRSAIYSQIIHEYDRDAIVLGKACPLFCPLVEEGWLHDTVTEEVAYRYLSEFKDRDIDTLIMGCTHYPLIRSTIKKVMGEDVNLVNPAYETALSLKKLLGEKNLRSEKDLISNSAMYEFYLSDEPRKFVEFANSVLPFDIENVKQINIEEF
jgi:glutamate racemase